MQAVRAARRASNLASNHTLLAPHPCTEVGEARCQPDGPVAQPTGGGVTARSPVRDALRAAATPRVCVTDAHRHSACSHPHRAQAEWNQRLYDEYGCNIEQAMNHVKFSLGCDAMAKLTPHLHSLDKALQGMINTVMQQVMMGGMGGMGGMRMM